jgi:hypothetical protein
MSRSKPSGLLGIASLVTMGWSGVLKILAAKSAFAISRPIKNKFFFIINIPFLDRIYDDMSLLH